MHARPPTISYTVGQSTQNQLYSGAIYTNQLYSGAIYTKSVIQGGNLDKSVIQWGNLHKISYTVGQSTQNQLYSGAI